MDRILGSFAAFSIAAFASIAVAHAADEFKLSNNQRIACGRGHNAGKLQTINCKSYAFIFNTRTSDLYRCQVNVGVTRDNTDVLKIDSDGSCALKTRVFATESNYSFDATETEPPNTNSFFGSGGTALWVSDNSALKAKGCILLDVGIGPEVVRCVDMTFGK